MELSCLQQIGMLESQSSSPRKKTPSRQQVQGSLLHLQLDYNKRPNRLHRILDRLDFGPNLIRQGSQFQHPFSYSRTGGLVLLFVKLAEIILTRHQHAIYFFKAIHNYLLPRQFNLFFDAHLHTTYLRKRWKGAYFKLLSKHTGSDLKLGNVLSSQVVY